MKKGAGRRVANQSVLLLNFGGGHQAAEALNALGAERLIAAGAFLLPIKMLTVIVQALIFCLLTCVYLALVTHHEEEPKAKPAG